MRGVVAGIFVGGESSRMGGRPKGLLTTPDGTTLVDRWRALFEELGVEHVLVGRREEYAAVPLVTLDDDPPGVGPIGGLAALLEHAGERRALVVACDMPFVTRDDVAALLASEDSVAVAARRDVRRAASDGQPTAAEARSAGAEVGCRRERSDQYHRWEPLFARFDAPRALPVVRRHIEERRHGLQALLTELGARPIAIEGAHLRDWDSPQDREDGKSES